MKKIVLAIAFNLAFSFYFSAFAGVGHTEAGRVYGTLAGRSISSSPHADFSKQWVDFDVVEGGIRGMRVHLKFTLFEMKGLASYVAIYFQDDLGHRLKDKDQKYASSTGDVAVYQSLLPCCDPSDYADLQLFMPYDQLDLDAGKYNLTMDVELIYKQGGAIQHLNYFDFLINTPGNTSNTTRTESSENANFQDMWVDFDVTENNVKGMRLHVKFTLANMKDKHCFLVVSFLTKNGERLTTSNTDYSTASGQVAVKKSLSPGFNDAIYKDEQLFMPYNQLNLAAGKYNLTMDVDLQYPNGDVIKHLKYFDFLFQN